MQKFCTIFFVLGIVGFSSVTFEDRINKRREVLPTNWYDADSVLQSNTRIHFINPSSRF